MFDLAWSEIGVIVAVAIIVIGPKDLPETIRGIARGVGKLRRMAGEFQGHLDEVVREAKLEDVRDQIRDIRNFDLKGEVERAVDREGTIRDSFRDDPFRAPPVTPSADAAPAVVATPVGESPVPPTDSTAAVDPVAARAPEALPSAEPEVAADAGSDPAPRDVSPGDFHPGPAPIPALRAEAEAPSRAPPPEPPPEPEPAFTGGTAGPLPADAAPPVASAAPTRPAAPAA